MSKGCANKLKSSSPELHDFLEKKAGVYSDATKEAWKKAAIELQSRTLDNLNNIYADLGVAGYEKIQLPTKEVNGNGAAVIMPEDNKPPNVVPLLKDFTASQNTTKAAVIMPEQNKSPDIVPLKSKVANEGADLLRKIDEEGYVPSFIQDPIKKIAEDNGIVLGAKPRMDDFIKELRKKVANETEIIPEANPADQQGQQQKTESSKDSSQPDKPVKETEGKTAFSKKAKELASKIRKDGIHATLPNWAKADLPDGTEIKGFGGKGLDDAIAKAIELVADAVDATKDFADAINEGYQHLRDYYKANTKSFDEEKLKANFERNINDLFEHSQQEADQDEQSEQSGEYNFGQQNFSPGDDPITNHTLKTKDLDKAFGTELTMQNVWNDMPSDDKFKMQVNMLGDGKEMIGLAQSMFGGPDIKVYGPKLFEFIKGMPSSSDNKKVILLATFLGEMKNEMERTQNKELQSLYGAASLYYRNFMHVTAKNLAAGRILRLFRDKYMADIFQDVILEEQQVKESKDLKDSVADTEIKTEDAAAHRKARDKGKSQEQADTEKKSDAATASGKRKQAAERKKTKKDVYSDLHAKKESEVKAKHGDKKGLTDFIIDKINKLNCP